MRGPNEPRAQQAPNNNIDGLDANVFNWDDSPDEHLHGSAYRGNCSLMPSDGGVCSIHGFEDYDDVCNSNDGRDNNVHNGNDDKNNGNIYNGNDHEASNNGTSSDQVRDVLQGQNNNVLKEPQEVLVQDREECNNLQQLNKNFNHVTASKPEGVVEKDEDMPIS